MSVMVAEDVALKPFTMAGFSATSLPNPQRTQLRMGSPKPKRWILDVDGTAMLRTDREPYDWDRVGEDVPNYPVVEIVRGLAAIGKKFLVVSGRLNVCRAHTIMSLRAHVFRLCSSAWHNNDLFMRDAARQNMPDDELKREIYLHDIQPRFDVEGVLDDRDRVVTMWRALGLPCMQVADGDF